MLLWTAPGSRKTAADCCGVFLPPQKAQCNPGGATSRLGARALPIARNGSPLDMALSARIGDAREGGRKRKMPQQPAASRPGAVPHVVLPGARAGTGAQGGAQAPAGAPLQHTALRKNLRR